MKLGEKERAKQAIMNRKNAAADDEMKEEEWRPLALDAFMQFAKKRKMWGQVPAG